MLRPGVPEKAVKASQQETRGTHENNKTRPTQRIGGFITNQPIRSMGT
jgi:hypothetical protein